jgi:hydrogenase nickel incorporation protein HypA/HybF
MHELSLAQNILEIVEQHVPRDQSRSVKSIKLRLGEMSGIVSDSLEFCFSAIVAETPMSNAMLDIERIPFTLACRTCRNSFVSEVGVVLCPECGGCDTDVVSGTELQVVEIELCESEPNNL